MKYLFLVSIGPVQTFIESARRTRDLAFGSWFLSELSRAAAKEIVTQNDLGSLIFPAPASAEMLDPNNENFSVANKIIAVVQQSPQTLGKSIRKAVMIRLGDIRKSAFERIRFTDEKQRSIAEAQINDLVEFLWVALPLEGTNYAVTRANLEALMAARKNTRDFQQVPWGSSAPKSSIGGQLESVIPKLDYPLSRESEEQKRKKVQALYKNYGAGPAEHLSGVDLLKRRGVMPEGEHFQSTSHMATLPFLERLKVFSNHPLQGEVQGAWETYIHEVQKLAFSPELEQIPLKAPSHPILGRYDGSMLFEGRLVDVLYVPGEDQTKSEKQQKAKKELQKFYEELNRQCATLGLEKARPEPYYAFLQADGDSMGELINAQAEQGPDQHQRLSQVLSHFATQVRSIVSENRGALVYAGGDDVMAFLPLDTALTCASKLSQTFATILQEFEFKDQNGKIRKPSLSTGIVIVHHLDSLHRVRQLAKRAEERAKGLSGKNALSITLSKRSGEDYAVAGHWQSLDANLQQLIKFFREETLPTGMAYELRELILRLGLSTNETHAGAHGPASHPNTEVIKWDALRIIKRKLYVPRNKVPQEQAEEAERFFITQLGIEQEKYPDIETGQSVTLGELINELIVAQVLAEAQDVATLKKEGSHV